MSDVSRLRRRPSRPAAFAAIGIACAGMWGLALAALFALATR